ncbi:hypothetical protein HPB52_004324 [Rhipicephalus sanguineus]|uniref:Uncharacterized protein n=1 Tax=Rhipicephalus sanguineus TaxID=34632 RepID=A0A9D4PLQ8_RHISA|nr:hypothetical protein HPB52_004324 [Rhipicephalus sanguineus]
MQVCTYQCKPRPHVIRHMYWDAFRARCQHSATPDIKDLSQWTDQLLADLDAALDREIETHTTTLTRQQWEQVCSGLSNQLGCKQSRHLLCHLLHPTSVRSVTRQQLQHVIQAYPGDTSSLMADVAAKYLQLLPSHGLYPPLAS